MEWTPNNKIGVLTKRINLGIDKQGKGHRTMEAEMKEMLLQAKKR